MVFNVEAFVSGWIGGAFSVVAAHPLDTIKVRLQTSTSYRGTLDCVRKTMKIEGVRGFYKGMSFPLVTASAYNSFVFGAYQHFQSSICLLRYGSTNYEASIVDRCFAAMGTGAASVLIGSPVDLIKIRLQTQTQPSVTTSGALNTNHAIDHSSTNSNRGLHKTPTRTMGHAPGNLTKYKGPIDCFCDIFRQNGLRGLYRGAPTMILRDIPGYTVYLVPYDMMKKTFLDDKKEHGASRLLACSLVGGFCGVISWGVTHPIDTVKSRLQADSKFLNPKYRGAIHCAISLYKDHGLPVFFRGLTLNALRGFPQSAALFCGVELTTQMFKKAE